MKHRQWEYLSHKNTTKGQEKKKIHENNKRKSCRKTRFFAMVIPSQNTFTDDYFTDDFFLLIYRLFFCVDRMGMCTFSASQNVQVVALLF